MSIVTSLPDWLLAAAWHGSLAIGVIWLLRPFFRRWAGAQAAHALWFLVFVELLSPWHPPSPMGIFPLRSTSPNMESPMRISVSVQDGESVSVASTKSGVIAPSSRNFSGQWPVALWLLGAGIVLAISGSRAVRAGRIVRKSLDISKTTLVHEVLLTFPKLPRRLSVRETRDLRSPALAGIWHPVILLPQGWDTQWNSTELRLVFAHEIGHLRRGDLLWRWAFLLVGAIHWFNPLVWLAQRSARADEEMACDEWVLLHSRTLDLRLYGEVLLKALQMLERPGLSSPVHATMAESKSGFKRRIRHLSQIREHGWLASAAAGTFMVLFALIVGPAQGGEEPTELVPVPPPQTPSIEVLNPAVISAVVKPAVVLNKDPQVEIEIKLVEIHGKPEESVAQLLGLGKVSRTQSEPLRMQGILDDAQYQKIFQQLSLMKSADVLAAPKVTAKSGTRAAIEVTREFSYPTRFEPSKIVKIPNPGQSEPLFYKEPVTPTEFETRNVGVSIELEPRIAEDHSIELIINPQVTEFEGFINYGAGHPVSWKDSSDALDNLLHGPSPNTDDVNNGDVINQPIFKTRRIQTSASVRDGQTVMICGIGSKDQQTVTDKAVPTKKHPRVTTKTYQQDIQRYLLIFVTPRLVTSANNAAVLTPSPSVPASVQNPNPLPVGVFSPQKPGFVNSPYAPDKGFVDVRGFPSGTQVKCPYTGQIFVVP